MLESGGTITQETRLYNAAEGHTYSMRSKEQAHDYRYFPEPDLLPLVVDEAWRKQIAANLPELPEAKRKRLVEHYGITEADAATLTRTQSMADQFEEAASAAKNPKRVANLVQARVARPPEGQRTRDRAVADFDEGHCPLRRPGRSGAISGKQLKELYDLAFERSEDFPAIYEKEKPQQITDTAAIEKMIDDVIAANPKQFEQYRGGKKTVAGFFVGQIMKASKGQANPALVNELLTKKLDG